MSWLGRGPCSLVVAFIMVMVSAEGVARLVAMRLGESSGWNDPGLAVQARNMRRVAAEHGKVDVVVLGASTTGEGIDPDRLVEASQVHGSAYNAWHAGAPARSLDLLARSLVLPLLRPKVVVIGLPASS